MENKPLFHLPLLAVGVSHFTKDLKTGERTSTTGVAIRDADKNLILEMSLKLPFNIQTARAKKICELINQFEQEDLFHEPKK
jgi:hypothetical protein